MSPTGSAGQHSFELAANGLTNREIGEQLFVSPHTVNSHLRQVFAKLEVSSRVELTRLATERMSEHASEMLAAARQPGS